VHYVKDNFLNARSFDGLDDLNAQGFHWLDNTANVRIHGTTQCKPTDLFAQEKLTAYTSIAPYRYQPWISRKVDSESFVHFGTSRYSVPPTNVGRKVLVQQADQKILIRCADLIIAEHQAAAKPGSRVADKAHIAELWKLSLANSPDPRPHWEVRFTNTVESPSLAAYEEVSQ